MTRNSETGNCELLPDHWLAFSAGCAALILTAFIAVPNALAQSADRRAVPAEFLFQLQPPGQTNSFLRPGPMFADTVAREVYIVDQGNARIVVFDENGSYRFEFSVSAYCGSIRDLAVTSKGVIFALASTTDGIKLLQFDFDGQYLGEVIINDSATTRPGGESKGEKLDLSRLAVSSLDIDDSNQLYLLDAENRRVIRLDTALTIRETFPILADITGKESREATLGALTWADHEILIPVASLGAVYRYSEDGEYIGSIGYQGSKVGELSLPVAATKTNDGVYIVLDKQRFTVLSYGPDGKFLGEFGGKGQSLGWFYFPSKLTIDSRGQIYIGQLFLNRIQVCAFPRVFRDKISTPTEVGATDPSSGLNKLYHRYDQTVRIESQRLEGALLTTNRMEVQDA